ncbi:MAG: pyrroline-5-carboxylate reductase [Bifidobacteriaceae bacterium]|jgi:pyrroline-5-carboxylate reductase|nr:pyrroline-5-carboxylate reductase [Bifidobacteriaceae bacterium]
MSIGFIGAGNMAGAIIRGIVGSGYAPAARILAYDPHAPTLDALVEQTGIVPVAGNPEVIAADTTVVLAVKPQVIPRVMEEVAAQIVAARPLVISIAAGTPIQSLERWLGPEQPIVRAMPNVNAQVRQAVTAVAGNGATTPEQLATAKAIFTSVGEVVELDESLFRAFAALAGSSPAWTFLYIDALARGGVAAGMPKALALQIAAKAVAGSAALLADGGAHPWELIDQVSSPAGTTIAGLTVLEEKGLSSAVLGAVAATMRREEMIARKNRPPRRPRNRPEIP